MQLLAIYYCIESHCCPYLFNDVLFLTGNELQGYHILPLWNGAKLGATAHTLCSGDLVSAILVLCPLPLDSSLASPRSKPGIFRLLSVREKDSISKKNLGAFERGMIKGSLMRQHFIHYFQNSHLFFGHLLKACVQLGFREMGEIAKLGI